MYSKNSINCLAFAYGICRWQYVITVVIQELLIGALTPPHGT